MARVSAGVVRGRAPAGPVSALSLWTALAAVSPALTAYDHTADEVRTYPLHRITGVAELADEQTS